ncbi:MAG: hypothetical protein FWD77_07080, partial [Betaproteobacteria bacterium]|nr:hypothetical protein [Betaproteobacteria bacterium]
MKRVLAHTLGGLALGVLVAGPVLAQEVIICPGASILPGDPPGAFCPPTARYLGPMMGNAWAPSDTVTANKSDSLSGNSVTVRGALTGAAVGGFNRVDTDEVSGNEILVAGSSGTPASLSTNAVGGFADQGADVRGNRVTVNEYGSVGAIIYGGYADSDGSAISNSVVIDKWSSIFSINAYGGQARSTGNATGNHFETSDSNVVLASVYGGYTLFGIATGNTVSIVNTTSTATGNPIYGGFCGGSYGPLTGLATNNTVEITDSTIRNPGVYGGYGTSGATGNTVIISGTTNFSAGTALIYGGYQTGGIANDSFTDNLLALHNYTGTANVGRVEGFASYEFLISDDSLPLNVVYTDTSSDGQVHFTPTNNVPSGASSTVTVVDLASGQTLTRQKTALLCPDSGFSGTITNNNAAPTQASASY